MAPEAVDGREIGKFGVTWPMFDSFVEDAGAYEYFKVRYAPEQWTEAVRKAGGEPAGEPQMREHDNLYYGSQVTDPRTGEIAVTEDGEPVIDHVKLYLYVYGPAYKPVDPAS